MTENEIRIINGNEIVLYRDIKTGLYRLSKDAVDVLLKAFEEKEQYEAIGTIDEFKALKDKNTPKKVLSIPEDDTCIYSGCYCPSCMEPLSNISRMTTCFCGQKLDWK